MSPPTLPTFECPQLLGILRSNRPPSHTCLTYIGNRIRTHISTWTSSMTCVPLSISNIWQRMPSRLFPFSQKDKAKQWLNSSPSHSIPIWAQLHHAFLTYAISKSMEMCNAITNFTMLDGELFHEAWERFNDLQRKCPHHEILRWQLVKSFYDGLSD